MSRASTKKNSLRTVITVRATKITPDLWEVVINDRSGLLAKTSCHHKTNVASIAVETASTILHVPHGRIKVDRVVYA